jgi:hypothetical protein
VVQHDRRHRWQANYSGVPFEELPCERRIHLRTQGLGGGGGRVEKFRRDGWPKPCPVGPEMLCYMLSHEAHRRGQVCTLAHQFGFHFRKKWRAGSGIGKGVERVRVGRRARLRFLRFLRERWQRVPGDGLR